MDILTALTVAAKKVGVASSLLIAICTQETGLKNVDVENDKGTPSIGACQLKMGTVLDMGFHGTRKELAKPETNAIWAAKYLKKQLDRYNNNVCRATAAYNSGSYHENPRTGKPRNFRYIKAVKNLIQDPQLAMFLECDMFKPRFVGNGN